MIKNQRQLKTSSGDSIWIFDDVFDSAAQIKFCDFAENSYYRLTGVSLDVVQYKNDKTLLCRFSDEDLKNFGIFDHESFKELSNIIGNRYAAKSWILLSTHLSSYYFHPDMPKQFNAKTFLYYVNLGWDKDWGGETFFCDDHGEPEIAVSFKPNRVVIFDSQIPHKPSPLSRHAYPYRYSFVSQFLEK